jgi:amino-acid N-acetyltransferase
MKISKEIFSGDTLVRKAVLKDIRGIYDLVEHFAKKGEILHRPITGIYTGVRDFFVYEKDGSILATCALHVCWEDLGEIRSLVVKEGAAGRGIGKKLVAACIDEARALGLRKVFALTYKSEYFEKLKFKPVSKDMLPHKVWKDCIECFKFPHCDENAVIIEV